MIHTISQLLFILLIPFITLYAAKHIKFIKWISPIFICYAIGIIFGNLPFISVDKELMTTAAAVSVGIAIPALLFSCNFIKWLKHSKTTFLSYFLAILAVIIASSIAFVIFKDKLDEAWKIAGMMIGVYTGGTANMSAIGLAVGVEEETFILLNSADLLMAGAYFLFLITFAKPFFDLFLPKFKGYNDKINGNDNNKTIGDDTDGFNKLSRKQKIKNILITLGLSFIILGIAAGLSFLLTGKLTEVIVILTITTVGIIVSFSPRVHNMKGNYETGEFMLLVFAVAMGSLANFQNLIADSSAILIYCAIVVFGSVILHTILAIFFRIDSDTLIITATAAIYGPAFIAPVADAIKNREVIVAGIAMGLLGNAIGNYLGLAVSNILKLLI